jgi:Spy/CpxP family protein refolding chaperone
MKKQLILFLVSLCALSVSAQHVKNDSIHERFFNAKVRELVYRLEMTDDQKTKFVPVYRKYNDEMRAVWAEGRPKNGEGRKVEKGEHQKHERSSAEVAAFKKKHMQMQQKAQNVQMKYLDEFAKVLNAKQMSNFYEVEAKIQKKLMERKGHKGGDMRRDGKPGRNQKGKQGECPAKKSEKKS